MADDGRRNVKCWFVDLKTFELKLRMRNGCNGHITLARRSPHERASSSNEPLIDHLILDVEVNSEDLPIFPMS
jgi:hypothetical protein